MTIHVERATPIVKSKLKLKCVLKSGLCGYIDAHILLKGTITAAEQGRVAVAIITARNNEELIFKISTPFSDCTSDIMNTQIYCYL